MKKLVAWWKLRKIDRLFERDKVLEAIKLLETECKKLKIEVHGKTIGELKDELKASL